MQTKIKTAKLQQFGPLIGLGLIFILLAFVAPQFFEMNNLLNVLRQISINAILAFGMTFVILTGGIDLSVGSILALSSALTAGLMANEGIPVVVAVLLGICCGALLGLFNGWVISKGLVAPFIATLATMTIYRGITLVYTDGRPIAGLDDTFAWLGRGYFFGIPIPVIIMFIVFSLSYLLLSHTTFGRRVYALGGNEQATRLSGIRVDRIKIWVYTISGVMSALAGIILASRLNSAQPTAGITYELDAIAAVVIGGTSLSGGRGWIVGTIVGAIIIGVIDNGLNLLNVSSFYQQVVKGGVILLAVLLDRRNRKAI